MSEPEIAHRCSSCGASVRQSALFCHQCGNAMTDQRESPPVTANDAQKVNETEASYAEPTSSKQVPAELSKTQPAIDPKTKPLREQRQATERPPKYGRETFERPTRSTRAGLEGNVLGRVDRIRKVSSVVLDQAAYDPSLRFLLVAGALFLLFLILLILSKLIG
jgi:hypothetical protein